MALIQPGLEASSTVCPCLTIIALTRILCLRLPMICVKPTAESIYGIILFVPSIEIPYLHTRFHLPNDQSRRCYIPTLLTHMAYTYMSERMCLGRRIFAPCGQPTVRGHFHSLLATIVYIGPTSHIKDDMILPLIPQLEGYDSTQLLFLSTCIR
jgi:hypothetical protein